LLRVSRVGHVSHLSSVDIRPDELSRRQLRLAPDPEVRRIADVHALLRTGEPVEEVLALLARRAGADRTLAVALGPAESPAEDGQPRLSALLALGGAGRIRTRDLSPGGIRDGLDALVRCRADDGPERMFAAPVLGPSSVGRASLPRERERVWYRQPWVWAVIGTVALGATAAAVAARASSDVPDGLEFEVTPRP